ncbi:MAG: lysostaphin resistance A-like protein [Bacteroidales bacterium]
MASQRSTFYKLITAAVVFLLFTLLTGGISAALLWFVPSETATVSTGMLRIIQLISSLFIFIIPTFVTMRLISSHPLRSLSLTTGITPLSIGIMLLLMTSISPLIGWLEELNKSIVFPESLAWLESSLLQKEEQARGAIEQLIQGNGLFDYVSSFTLVALLAGIGEELLFRGGLQNAVCRRIKNPHVGIWVVAILFSAIHLQFYGFVPRVILGAVLGYLLLWSGSLWLPILAHTYNNAAYLTIQYLVREKKIDFDPETFLWSEHPLWLALSILLMVGITILATKMIPVKKRVKQVPIDED